MAWMKSQVLGWTLTQEHLHNALWHRMWGRTHYTPTERLLEMANILKKIIWVFICITFTFLINTTMETYTHIIFIKYNIMMYSCKNMIILWCIHIKIHIILHLWPSYIILHTNLWIYVRACVWIICMGKYNFFKRPYIQAKNVRFYKKTC